jgi:hypothetical protein
MTSLITQLAVAVHARHDLFISGVVSARYPEVMAVEWLVDHQGVGSLAEGVHEGRRNVTGTGPHAEFQTLGHNPRLRGRSCDGFCVEPDEPAGDLTALSFAYRSAVYMYHRRHAAEGARDEGLLSAVDIGEREGALEAPMQAHALPYTVTDNEPTVEHRDLGLVARVELPVSRRRGSPRCAHLAEPRVSFSVLLVLPPSLLALKPICIIIGDTVKARPTGGENHDGAWPKAGP